MIEETCSEERPSSPTGHHGTSLEEEASYDFKSDAMDQLCDSAVIDDTADPQAEPITGVSEVDPDSNSNIEMGRCWGPQTDQRCCCGGYDEP